MAAHLGRNEDGQPLRSSLTSVHRGRQSSINTGGNLPPNGTLLSHHAQPFIPNSVPVPNGFTGNPSVGGASAYPPQGGYFADATGSVTPFVRWIEEYPLLDGLKMPFHVASKRGSQKRTWQFTSSNKEKARVSELSPLVRNLVEHLSTDLPSTYKGLMEKTYTWIEAREVATNGAPNDRRDNSERSRKSSWDNGRGQRSRDRFSPYRGPNHGLLSSMSKSPREILAKEKLRSQIKEAVRSDQVSHLVKGIKKERTKTSNSQRGEKKEKSTTPAEEPILMINQKEARTRNNISKSPTFKGREIKFPLVTKDSNSSAPVIIKAKIFEREVGRVHMNSGNLCEVIYEHCFLKLKPSIQAFKVDSQVPLVGFSREKSWAIGEVLLKITIGNALLTRSENLNFIIVRSNSVHYMLLGRTTMQKIRMVVSTIHRAVKFHTTQGIGTVFSTHESDKIEGVKKVRETSLANTEGVLSCTDAEEKIIVNNKYTE
ncbi:hypothetical protein Tco_0290459 [Tanacetum coccineum]